MLPSERVREWYSKSNPGVAFLPTAIEQAILDHLDFEYEEHRRSLGGQYGIE